VVYGNLTQTAAAEEHFQRALTLDPRNERIRYIYARWLDDNGRGTAAVEHLRIALRLNPDFLDSLYLLMKVYAENNSWQTVHNLADYLNRRFPADIHGKAYLLMASAAGIGTSQASLRTAENLVNLATLYHASGKFESSIAAGREALALRPDFPEAYIHLAETYRAMGDWDHATEAARQALSLRPQDRAARENLLKAQSNNRK
jgi:uncharacterized protein (TIGR02996 family)